jgi:hypothetical protein
MNVLINHPYFGSLWLSNARIEGDHVVGEAWDDTWVGAPNFPDDYRGEPATMNFPVTCIRRRTGDT